MPAPTDPLFASQWHFNLLGDIQTIWNEYTGVGVRVGVYDDGLQYTHPDLAGNYNASLHFVYDGTTYDPSPISLTGDGHGTSCAGLIAAVANNGVGGVGVAYGAQITGVNYLEQIQVLSQAINLAALQHAQVFDIMSNSWGRTPTYDSNQSLLNNLGDVFAEVQAMGTVVGNGRGGLGTIIVQAAGNDTLNANGDGINATRFTTSIAALQANGFVQDYSNFGACILVSAGAGAVTTDLTGTGGYNTTAGAAGNYTNTFGGTSAATPVVAGVVALMLDANDQLGWRDVQNILAISAAHTGSAYGAAGSGFEVGAWGENGATNWNGGGMQFHLSYGFGRADAYAAVRMAEVWSILNGPALTLANEQRVVANYTGAALSIPDAGNGFLEVQLNVTNNIRIEDISVSLTMSHTYAGDLSIFLVGPNGETIPLVFSGEGGNSVLDGFAWQFGVTGALGMLSAGIWSLRVYDSTVGDTGILSALTIEFFGSANSTNNVYSFTQDLHTLVALDALRSTIIDTNGGTDWLNFSAMGLGNISVNLASGSATFTGQSTQLAISNIENVMLGDGNDTVVGNAQANVIYGMRGNDTLAGGAGADTITGGGGNDTIYGGAAAIDATETGNDILSGGDGLDSVYGNGGNDTITGGLGADFLIGGTGDDTLYGGLSATDTTDLSDDFMRGGDGTDLLYGNRGNDTVLGGAGVDTIYGGDGNDILYGGAFLVDATDIGDTVFGGAGNDDIRGNGGDDMLYGEAGDDSVIGGVGNDQIYGGTGNDYLRGGDGNDRFIFNTALNATTNVDTIQAFVVNVDDIVLSQAIFAGIGATLDATEFQIGLADASTDRIIYNQVTGELFYDSNGNGSGGSTLFAILNPGTALTINDFVMVA